MRVGLDFDNTIISYDRVFRTVALEQRLVPPDVPASKLAVRNYLRDQGREDAWTELQGYVYGRRLADAEPYDGVLAFLARARTNGFTVSIVSHKTRSPYLGPRYDLHAAAREWIATVLRDNAGPLVPPDRVYFHETKAEKIARICSERCHAFVDDLPEILVAPEFPASTRPILFDPQHSYPDAARQGITVLGTWRCLDALLAQPER